MPHLRKPHWKGLFAGRKAAGPTPFDKLCSDFRRIGQGVRPGQHQYVLTLGLEELTRFQSVFYDLEHPRADGPSG